MPIKFENKVDIGYGGPELSNAEQAEFLAEQGYEIDEDGLEHAKRLLRKIGRGAKITVALMALGLALNVFSALTPGTLRAEGKGGADFSQQWEPDPEGGGDGDDPNQEKKWSPYGKNIEEITKHETEKVEVHEKAEAEKAAEEAAQEAAELAAEKAAEKASRMNYGSLNVGNHEQGDYFSFDPDDSIDQRTKQIMIKNQFGGDEQAFNTWFESAQDFESSVLKQIDWVKLHADLMENGRLGRDMDVPNGCTSLENQNLKITFDRVGTPVEVSYDDPVEGHVSVTEDRMMNAVRSLILDADHLANGRY